MSLTLEGVMQSTVTPFKDDFSLDQATFERLLDFHVRTSGTTISWPHHKSESPSLTIAERKHFAEVAVKVVNKRVPVTIYVNSRSIEDVLSLARHAQEIGADGIICATPYFWKSSQQALYDHFVYLATAVDLPLIVYNSPNRLGVEFTGELMKRLVDRLPNLVGIKEASFNSEKFVELARAIHSVRPSFALIAAVEFLAPSVPLGCVGAYSAAGAVSPTCVRSFTTRALHGRACSHANCSTS